MSRRSRQNPNLGLADAQAILARQDVSNLGTRMFEGRYSTINQAAATTWQVTCELAQHADAVRPIFANASTQISNRVAAVKVSVIASTADLNNSAGTWVQGNRGGLPNIETAIAPASGRVAYTTTDWIPISTLARTDSGTKPLLIIRAVMSATSVLTVYGDGVDDFTNWATRTNGRLWAARSQSGDAVTDPTGFTSTTAISQCPIVGVQYLARGRVVTVMGGGDSITDGRGTYLGEGFVYPACDELSSTTGTAVEYANLGWSGQAMATFTERILDALESDIRPDVLVFPTGSPNDQTSTLTAAGITALAAARGRLLSACADRHIVPVLWTWLPTNTSVRPYGSSDALRVADNAGVLAQAGRGQCLGGGLLVADTATAFSGSTSSGQVQIASGLTTDNIHPNDTGNTTLKGVLKPVLAQAFGGLSGGLRGLKQRQHDIPTFTSTDINTQMNVPGVWVWANTSSAGTWTLGAFAPSPRTAAALYEVRVRETATAVTITATATQFLTNGGAVSSITVRPGETAFIRNDGGYWLATIVPAKSTVDLVFTEWAGVGQGSAIAAFGTANRTLYARVRNGGTITKVRLEVGTSSGNISLAVYRNTGAGSAAAPSGAPVATTGAIACPASGVNDVALGSTVNVLPGDWLALSYDNTTATFRTVSVAAASALWSPFGARQDSAHPAPTVGTLAITSTLPVLIGVP